MHGAEHFLRNLALVLCVAAFTTVLFQRLRQPVVLGYLLAGLIIGPHVPIPLRVDEDMVRTLSELGVILLMFALGLEFSLKKLMKVGATAALVAVLQVTLMLWLGYLVGRLFGWSTRASLFTGAAISISSTTIVAKAFEEQKVEGRQREIVFGVLIVQDLIAILLLATLGTMAAGRGLSAQALALTAGKLTAFLVGLVIAGLFVVPRFMRMVVRLGRPETTLVASVGLCFGVSQLAHTFGYSVALGAFLAGSLVAESGEARQVEKLVQPVRDMFAAIFFVAVGLQIDPSLIVRYWVPIAVLTVVVVVGDVLAITVGVFLTGNGVRTALRSAFSLAQIGEFSFIIAGMAVATGAAGQSLYVVAVAVSAITTLLTPWLIRGSDPLAAWVDRKLPHRMQTFVALYGSWVEQLGKGSRGKVERSRGRRLVQLLVIDAACLVGVIIATSLWLPDVTTRLVQSIGVSPMVARLLAAGGAIALGIPLALGIVRLSRQLGLHLAGGAMPAGKPGKADLAAAPRKVLVLTLQLACILLVGIPIVAVTQPFLPVLQGAMVLLLVLLVLGFVFWRSAANLQGHVRAGAEVIAEALAAQRRSEPAEKAIEPVRELLPGLGTPTPFRLPDDSPAIGRTLKALNLRGLTGATVLAIKRPGADVIVPGPDEVLQAGDTLALAGSGEALAAAYDLLIGTDRG